MANLYSDSLFELIHCLTKSEKRFYKLYASRHTIGDQNNALIIFNYIAKLSIYDEEKLIIHFKGESFLNQFSITKSRIYQQILECLTDYHQKKSTEKELMANLNSAVVLYNKGLYSQYNKLLISVKKKAIKKDLKSVILRVIQLEKKYHEKHFYTTINNNDLIQLNNDEISTLKVLEVNSNLWYIKSRLFSQINRFGVIRSIKEVDVLKEIINPINELEIDSNDIESYYLLNHIKSGFYFATHQIEKCSEVLNKNIVLFELNQFLIKKSPNRYFGIITNYIYCQIKLGRFDQAKKYLNLLKEQESKFLKNNDLEIKYFSSRLSLRLFYDLERMDFSNSDCIIEEIELGLDKYGHKVGTIRTAFLNFQIGIIYLSQEQYKLALKSINKVINDKNALQKQDIYSFALLLRIVIHFELKNYDFLTYIIASTKRFLKDKKSLYKFESVFLKLIQKIKYEQLNLIEIEEIFSAIIPDIEALKDDKFELVAFENFDFLAWLRSKVERKTYLEIRKAG